MEPDFSLTVGLCPEAMPVFDGWSSSNGALLGLVGAVVRLTVAHHGCASEKRQG